MSLRLRLASWWMPQTMVAREIGRIRSRTDEALDALLSEYAPGFQKDEPEGPGHTPEELRSSMARGHERKVRALIGSVGRDKAISLGRDAMFHTGLELGSEAKARLGVKGTKEDLFRAARVLYRILGIEFDIVSGPEGQRMEVFRCPLSRHYSPEACRIMSAVDEGTFSGLCPCAGLLFEKRMTDGSPRCVAMMHLKEGR